MNKNQSKKLIIYYFLKKKVGVKIKKFNLKSNTKLYKNIL